MGAMARASLSSGFQSSTPIPTIKLGHSGAGSRVSGPVHTLGRCGSPTTSSVRLGVSPAAAPTPRGAFNQRFEALFPRAGALGCTVCLLHCPPFVRFICGRIWCRGVLPAALPAPLSATLSPALWVYLHKCGAAGSATAQTACAICPTLCQSQSRHSHASPLHPGAHLRPSYQSG